MHAKSKSQQKAAGAALAAKRNGSKSELRGASKEMFQSMNEDELKDLAHTKLKNLPEHKNRT